jgi:hypothetical protein
VLPFGVLQQRIGRTKLTPKLLERRPGALPRLRPAGAGGVDLRASRWPSGARRLGRTARDAPRRRLSPALEAADWAALAAAARGSPASAASRA